VGRKEGLDIPPWRPSLQPAQRCRTRLVEELEARMKKMGIPKVNALIYPWNHASVEFFKNAGYQVEDMKESQKWLGKKPGAASRKSRSRAGSRLTPARRSR